MCSIGNFFTAAKTGDIDILRQQIENGININIKDRYGDDMTALMYATYYADNTGLKSPVQFLVEAGANLNIRNRKGYTAMHIASLYPNNPSFQNVIKILYEAGADLNLHLKDKFNKETPLMLIIQKNKVYDEELKNIIVSMINSGKINLESVDEFGRTVLQQVLSNHHAMNSTPELMNFRVDIAIKLIQAGASKCNFTENPPLINMMYYDKECRLYEYLITQLLPKRSEMQCSWRDKWKNYKNREYGAILLEIVSSNKYPERTKKITDILLAAGATW